MKMVSACRREFSAFSSVWLYVHGICSKNLKKSVFQVFLRVLLATLHRRIFLVKARWAIASSRGQKPCLQQSVTDGKCQNQSSRIISRKVKDKTEVANFVPVEVSFAMVCIYYVV